MVVLATVTQVPPGSTRSRLYPAVPRESSNVTESAPAAGSTPSVSNRTTMKTVSVPKFMNSDAKSWDAAARGTAAAKTAAPPPTNSCAQRRLYIVWSGGRREVAHLRRRPTRPTCTRRARWVQRYHAH